MGDGRVRAWPPTCQGPAEHLIYSEALRGNIQIPTPYTQGNPGPGNPPKPGTGKNQGWDPAVSHAAFFVTPHGIVSTPGAGMWQEAHGARGWG